MSKNILITCCFGILIIMGCHKKNLSAIKSDENLTLQAMNISSTDSSAAYNVRIFPKKRILEEHQLLSQKMSYDLDSCFYVLNDGRKIYAVGVECIANGVAGSFEYLVRFDCRTEGTLFYQDKNINQKNYQLVLK